MVNTTTDPEKLLERVRKLKPGGGSALYDAIYDACTSRTLVKGEPIEPRRVIVIIGDGHDTASKKTLEEVLEIAQRNLVTIYGVSTTAFGFFSEATRGWSNWRTPPAAAWCTRSKTSTRTWTDTSPSRRTRAISH